MHELLPRHYDKEGRDNTVMQANTVRKADVSTIGPKAHAEIVIFMSAYINKLSF